MLKSADDAVNKEEKQLVIDYLNLDGKKKAKEPWVLSINDHRKTKWDLFVMVLAIFNVFVIPIDVGFEPVTF